MPLSIAMAMQGEHMKAITLGCTLLLLLSASLCPAATLASTAQPKMKCTVGPVAKQYGGTSWLVYSCEDGKSVLIASAPTNKAVRFHFTFVADEDGYALHGEGQGDKQVTDAAFNELNSLKAADIAALVAETSKAHDG